MRVLDLYLYYLAANLTTVLRMNNQLDSLPWLDIELQTEWKDLCSNLIWKKNVRELMASEGLSPYLPTTLRIWAKLRPKLVGQPSRLIPLTGHQWFSSGIETLLRRWAGAGIKIFN